jgi:hypothetical protein
MYRSVLTIIVGLSCRACGLQAASDFCEIVGAVTTLMVPDCIMSFGDWIFSRIPCQITSPDRKLASN